MSKERTPPEGEMSAPLTAVEMPEMLDQSPFTAFLRLKVVDADPETTAGAMRNWRWHKLPHTRRGQCDAGSSALGHTDKWAGTITL